jgi:SAM-dependent methyltransferase
MSTQTEYYGKSYYDWQRSIGEIGASLDSWKFRPFLSTEMAVLDFGCGGGFMLELLPARQRWGVEVNSIAAREAATRLDSVVGSISEIPSSKQFDTIISNHALEHVENPLDSLRQLRAALRMGGKAVFVVPAESWFVRSRYDPSDINQHLYTWTPLLLGNLFTRAGYRVESIETLCHRWTPKAGFVRSVLGRFLFDNACRATALVTCYRQLRIVATRPMA